MAILDCGQGCARAGVSGPCGDGECLFADARHLVADLMWQLMRFPAGKYDDGVDVCSLIGRGLEFAKVPRIMKPKIQEPIYTAPPRHDGLSWMDT